VSGQRADRRADLIGRFHLPNLARGASALWVPGLSRRRREKAKQDERAFRVITLVCPGFGYSAKHYVTLYGKRFDRIVGTTRSATSAAAFGSTRFGDNAVDMLVFDGAAASPALAAAIADATVLLVSIAPDRDTDPVLVHLRDAIAAAPRLKSIVYL